MLHGPARGEGRMESRRADLLQTDGTVLIISTAPVSDKEAHSTATESFSYHQDPVTAVEEVEPAALPHGSYTAGVYQDAAAFELAAGTSGSQLQHISNSDLQEDGQNDDLLTAPDINAAAQHEAAMLETSSHTAGVYQDAAGTSELQLPHMSTSDLQAFCQNNDFLTALDSDAAAHRAAAVVGTSNHSLEYVSDDAEAAMRSIANGSSTSDIWAPHGTFGSIASNTSAQSDPTAPMDIFVDSREQEASLSCRLVASAASASLPNVLMAKT